MDIQVSTEKENTHLTTFKMALTSTPYFDPVTSYIKTRGENSR